MMPRSPEGFVYIYRLVEEERLTATTDPAVLDRASLRAIATGGGGEYFELDTQSDREIALKLISGIKRRGVSGDPVESHQDMYWPFLFAAAVVYGAGLLFLRDPFELSWHAVIVGLGVAILATALG